MSAAALALVLAAALMHATWNIVAKRTGGDTRFALMSALLFVAVWSPVAPASGSGRTTRRSGSACALFAALLGGHFLGEGERASRLLGAGCIAAGVAALALG